MYANKNLFVLLDEIEAYKNLFKQIKKISPFNIEVIEYSVLVSRKYKEFLKMYSSTDIIIAVNANFYNLNKRNLHEYMRKIYNSLFTNIMLLNTDSVFINDDDIILGKKHCFYLDNKSDFDNLAYNFILYAIKLFNECILSCRLVDYITHSFDSIVSSELLRKRKDEIELLNKELETKNKIDSLTNLYNRQAMYEFLEKEEKRAERDIWRINRLIKDETDAKITELQNKYDSEPIGDLFDHLGIFSVMMIDVDHFKCINDTYGHLLGDRVLKKIGDVMKNPNIFRESDILGRFGGEEFIGILPNTNVNNALGPAVRFTRALKKIEFKGEPNEPFKVTVSIGISEYHSTDKKKEEIINRADKALYWAKEQGRNQIAIYEKIFKK